MVVLDKEKVERSNWLGYARPVTAKEHLGYWYRHHRPEGVPQRRGD